MPKKTIKELEQELCEAQYKLETQQEKLYSAGIEERPTIMKTIRDREADALSLIKHIIKECEQETGRAFPYPIVDLHRNLVLIGTANTPWVRMNTLFDTDEE